jgi:hypothetical protein
MTTQELKQQAREEFEMRFCKIVKEGDITEYILLEKNPLILKDFLDSIIDKTVQQTEERIVGVIGARLLAKHSPQIVLDAYFDVANELLEKNENNN